MSDDAAKRVQRAMVVLRRDLRRAMGQFLFEFITDDLLARARRSIGPAFEAFGRRVGARVHADVSASAVGLVLIVTTDALDALGGPSAIASELLSVRSCFGTPYFAVVRVGGRAEFAATWADAAPDAVDSSGFEPPSESFEPPQEPDPRGFELRFGEDAREADG